MRLVGEHFSPWTEKARWALEHHGHAYAFREYTPVLDEPWLRFATRNFSRKPATIPVLFDERDTLTDSFAIAAHADRKGARAKLFPASQLEAIEAWNARSESALRAGRALFFARLERDAEAQLDFVPTFFPKAARPYLRRSMGPTLAYLRKKHGVDDAFLARAHEELDAALVSLREALSGRPHLLDELSYADLAMAVVFQFVKPVGDPHVPLSRAHRRCFTEAELAREHGDLLDWRDQLYAEHRGQGMSSSAPPCSVETR